MKNNLSRTEFEIFLYWHTKDISTIYRQESTDYLKQLLKMDIAHWYWYVSGLFPEQPYDTLRIRVVLNNDIDQRFDRSHYIISVDNLIDELLEYYEN